MAVPRWLGAPARHPIISAVVVICTLAGGFAGVEFLNAEWTMLRRALAGGVFGAWIGMLFTATKMVGQ